MAKKKRNKKYKGVDSVQTPAVIKVKAPDRSKAGEWFHENRQIIATRFIQIGLALVVSGLIYFIFL